jgi:hypothetical protein
MTVTAHSYLQHAEIVLSNLLHEREMKICSVQQKKRLGNYTELVEIKSSS